MTSNKISEDPVVNWLLEENQPSVRYLTLTELLGWSKNDPKVRSTKARITKTGWVSDILEKQNPGGWWIRESNLYQPKYISTNWMLLILSDLGLTKDNPGIDRACKMWIERFASKDGGFGLSPKTSHLCVAGNTARALVRFGYLDHPKVRSTFQWFVKNQAKLGGWSCWNFEGRSSSRNLDSWEPLSAFAVYPREKWTRSMKLAVEKGAEFFLDRELHKQGAHYEPWYRFHYPVHYYYDLLVGLDFMTALGYTSDKRLEHPVSVLRKKMRPDGRWNLDAVHPDLEGASAVWYKSHPKQAPIPFSLEKPGEASKMITLKARLILDRLGR